MKVLAFLLGALWFHPFAVVAALPASTHPSNAPIIVGEIRPSAGSLPREPAIEYRSIEHRIRVGPPDPLDPDFRTEC
jgi:hypothetical protein